MAIKRVSAYDKFELIYLVRKLERKGWRKGKYFHDIDFYKPWSCFMSWEGYKD